MIKVLKIIIIEGMMGNEVGKVARGYRYKEFGFHSTSNGELLKGFKQGKDMVRFVV